MYGKRKSYENARRFDRINYADSENIITDLLLADEEQAERFAAFVDKFDDQVEGDQQGYLAEYDGDAYTGCTAEGHLVHVRCKREARADDPGGYYVAFGSLNSDTINEMVVRGVYTPNVYRPLDRALEVRSSKCGSHDLLPRDQQRLSWRVGEDGVEFFYKNGLRNPINVPIVSADTLITALTPEPVVQVAAFEEQPTIPAEPEIVLAA